MRRNFVYFLLVTGLGFSTWLFLPGQEELADRTPVAKATACGYRAEFLEDVAYYEHRDTRLEKAMQADKYCWRPGRKFAPDSTRKPFLPLLAWTVEFQQQQQKPAETPRP